MTGQYSWIISIESSDGSLREISLDHQYANEEDAEQEAENIADQEYTENDVAWSLRRITK
jgi:hypothetical protein